MTIRRKGPATPIRSAICRRRFRRFFKDYPGMPRRSVPMPFHREGVGSGVIIDPSGVILTNDHVVDGGGENYVRLHDGREFEGTDVKRNPKTDLAILPHQGRRQTHCGQVRQ